MAQYTVEVAVDPSADGTITNTATVSTAATDPNAANDTATEDTLVTPRADLAITKIDSKDPVAPGDTLTYTIDVTNLGPSVAPNTVVTDTLPDEVTLVSTTGCTEDPNGVPTCSLGDIAVDDTVQFTIEVTVDLGTPTGTITNTATVASDAVDPDPANDTATEDTEVDADAPTVTLVDSLAGDGEIEECEEVRSSITQLLVSFSEPVQDPAGDSDADDVTNPANYLLVEAGPDRDFTTTDCSGAAGDDGAIGITGVTYDDGTDTATLTLDVIGSLGDDLYRLLVCGSTSIRDIAGNPLDGDDDGTGGDDFVRTYRGRAAQPVHQRPLRLHDRPVGGGDHAARRGGVQHRGHRRLVGLGVGGADQPQRQHRLLPRTVHPAGGRPDLPGDLEPATRCRPGGDPVGHPGL